MKFHPADFCLRAVFAATSVAMLAVSGTSVYSVVEKATTLKNDYLRAAECETKLDNLTNCTHQELESRMIARRNDGLNYF